LTSTEVTGETSIDASTTEAEITTNYDKATNDLKALYNSYLETDKTNAKKIIDNKATDSKVLIDSYSYSTDEEKTSLKKSIDDEVLAKKESRTDATTGEDIAALLTAATKGIDKTVSDSFALEKERADKEIEDKATASKEHINKMTSLTEKQKQDAIAEINNKVTTAKASVSSATTDEEVKAAVSTLVTDLGTVVDANLTTDKTNAKKEIEDKAAEVTQIITDSSNLSDEEKKALKDEVTAASKTATDAINASSDEDGVDKAVTEGKKPLAQISGKVAIIDETNKAIKEIGALTGLTEADKKALEAEIDSAKTSGTDLTTQDVALSFGTSASDATTTNVSAKYDKNGTDYPVEFSNKKTYFRIENNSSAELSLTYIKLTYAYSI